MTKYRCIWIVGLFCFIVSSELRAQRRISAPPAPAGEATGGYYWTPEYGIVVINVNGPVNAFALRARAEDGLQETTTQLPMVFLYRITSTALD